MRPEREGRSPLAPLRRAAFAAEVASLAHAPLLLISRMIRVSRLAAAHRSRPASGSLPIDLATGR
eukprot:4353655-Alexandrium_andersonii.AAC.1